MAKPVFDAKSISSIGGRGKTNSPRVLAYISSTLDERSDDLEAIMAATGFTTQNLSSMLARSGIHLGTSIDALMENQDALCAILKEGTFNQNNLSSMLSGAGKNLAIGIVAIQSRLPKLKELCTVFKPKQIAQRLHSTTAKNLGAVIDTMHALYEAERNGNTIFPRICLGKILHASPAAAIAEHARA